jgi:hypothetical protein
VPPAREHETRPRRRVVEHRLCRTRRVPVDASRDEHDEHPVAPRHRALDDLAVVRRSRNDGDAPPERVELLHALLAAHADHLVATIKRVLHHVPPELPRGSDDADLHRMRPVSDSRRESVGVARALKEFLQCLVSRSCEHIAGGMFAPEPQRSSSPTQGLRPPRGRDWARQAVTRSPRSIGVRRIEKQPSSVDALSR